MTAPIPAERHKDLFPDAKVPRTANFNPKVPTGGGWVQHLPLANQTVIDYQDHFYRQRLRSLQALDEMVDALITRLEESGQAENTYIIYTADNGFHIGQHRMPPGKSSGYEEDIHVPFYIRGPGIPKGKTDDSVTTHIDLAPTFFQLAGIPLREDFDGTPMSVAKGVKGIAHEHVAVEFWGKSPLEGDYGALG
jgi:arylsulfatase